MVGICVFWCCCVSLFDGVELNVWLCDLVGYNSVAIFLILVCLRCFSGILRCLGLV